MNEKVVVILVSFNSECIKQVMMYYVDKLAFINFHGKGHPKICSFLSPRDKIISQMIAS